MHFYCMPHCHKANILKRRSNGQNLNKWITTKFTEKINTWNINFVICYPNKYMKII